MRKLVPVIGAVLLVLGLAHSSYAQVPSLVKANLGVGGGLTVPGGDFGDTHKTGFNVGAKLRISGLIPVKLVGTASYVKLGGEDVALLTLEDAKILQLGAGLEYQLVPAPIVKPYLAGDVYYNNIDTGGDSRSRFGVGAGGGIAINMGGVLHLDGMVKYQALNIVGKDAGESTLYQVSATVLLMFNLK